MRDRSPETEIEHRTVFDWLELEEVGMELKSFIFHCENLAYVIHGY